MIELEPVGLYQIDARVPKASFAIVVGDRGFQGKGIHFR